MEKYTINNIEEIVKQVMASLQNNEVQVASSVGHGKSGRVAYLVEKQKIEVKTYDIPEITDDEVLVKIEGCGVCGTDVHEYKNDPFGLIPVVLGHEGTGEIIKIGKNVTKDMVGKPLRVGDKVVTSVTLAGSDEFTTLKPERANLSSKAEVYGLLPDDEYRFNGWFGDYIILRKNSSIFNVSDMGLDERILIEPAAVAVHAVERAKTTQLLRFDSKVLIQGCGPIGLLVLTVLRTMGIQNIIAIDGDDQRLGYAKDLGADYTFNFKNYKDFETMCDAVHEVTNGGVDFAFQCTGVPSAAGNIYKFIRRGGGLCEVGFFVDNGNATINPHWDFCQKEITVVGSWTYTFKDYVTTLDFLRRAKGIGLPVEKLITHKFSLDELNEAMEVNMKLQGIKVAYVNR
ncbi:MAG: zinc-dependent alcohol dehydrogenase [Zhenhengia sp.]|uniref:zinc-dependent alcohol dehydrogenase n=1 Tax=Zhenhengia sp. TaxID=2944208 RepID=UPI002910BAFE|nr:zinc-binding dehydrogenase [Clostridiales bacterium]MDU6854784.1 zinc-binding dehydrogenase [Clostridiales bacterium]MDU6974608.1 zinc-binding dehydrogenase [Clostridiales bacterium]